MFNLRLLLLAAALLFLAPHAFAAGEQNYCRQEAKSILLLIDRTTSFDTIDEKVLLSGFSTMLKQLEPGDRLTVATIEQSAPESQTLFDECWPGCPDQGLWSSLGSSCKPELAKLHRRHKITYLAERVKSILSDQKESRNSDILRTLSELTRTRRPDRIIIFSDMLENSDYLPYSRLVTRSPDSLINQVLVDIDFGGLAQAEVSIFGYGRSHVRGRPPLAMTEDRQIRQFWQGFLRKAGAVSVTMGRDLDIPLIE